MRIKFLIFFVYICEANYVDSLRMNGVRGGRKFSKRETGHGPYDMDHIIWTFYTHFFYSKCDRSGVNSHKNDIRYCYTNKNKFNT